MRETMGKTQIQSIARIDRHAIAWGFLLAMGLMAPSALRGQLSVMQMEVNGGASIPVADLAGAEGWEGKALADASFGIHFALTSGHLGYLVGFNEHRFRCPEAGCGA
jgi:hypothetical protein